MRVDVRVQIKLLGTLPSHFPGSYPASGIEAELPDNASVADMVAITGIPEARLGIVTVNGRLAKAADSIPENAEVKLFQKIAGG